MSAMRNDEVGFLLTNWFAVLPAAAAAASVEQRDDDDDDDV